MEPPSTQARPSHSPTLARLQDSHPRCSGMRDKKNLQTKRLRRVRPDQPALRSRAPWDSPVPPAGWMDFGKGLISRFPVV